MRDLQEDEPQDGKRKIAQCCQPGMDRADELPGPRTLLPSRVTMTDSRVVNR
ncbi:hypothetical protein HUK65_11990 [Rhodobacteraceae bacterium 2376]|uniref:Uncharacterized protein n=1 Tax=Rhabdonatronobacter sediminivivens TaxID=2743469 RepID=A0A7Z0I0M9_9RHOB|nr:hypothetical protein [Rhabdonatronobacter sediminivivens]NYS25713.1 hypothetical protein [Rhabdonatronobacter sediminivivens]